MRRILFPAAVLLAGAVSAQDAGPVLELPAVVGYQARALWTTERGYSLVYDQFDTPQSPRRIVGQTSRDGKTWTDPVRISPEGLSASGPVLAEGPDRESLLYFTGADDGKTYRAYVAVSKDGKEWSAPVLAPLRTDDAVVFNLHVTRIRDGRLLAAYQYQTVGTSRVGLAVSPDGRRWTDPGAPAFPTRMRPYVMQATDGTYHLTYQGRTPAGGFEVFARQSKDLLTWSEEVAITHDGNSHDAFLSEEPAGPLTAHYISTRGGQAAFDLQEAVSRDGGATWTWTRSLSETPKSEYAPALLRGPETARWLLYATEGEDGKTGLRALKL